MITVRTVSEWRSALTVGERVGLVPTMGAFHEGHLELMRQARRECDLVTVSLFVNPTQFNDPKDLKRYPRTEERDFALAESVGVDVMFAPEPGEVYPSDLTRVRVDSVASQWEGASRPGHFEGVATVVLKLFLMSQADVAYFGMKDLQQCAVISTMVRDLFVPISLRLIETVREPDGLAMSSRNLFLSPNERQIAPLLHRTLREGVEILRRCSSGEEFQSHLGTMKQELESSGFAVDYLAAVDPETMQELNEPLRASRLMCAAKLGTVRLLDNVALGSEP